MRFLVRPAAGRYDTHTHLDANYSSNKWDRPLFPPGCAKSVMYGNQEMQHMEQQRVSRHVDVLCRAPDLHWPPFVDMQPRSRTQEIVKTKLFCHTDSHRYEAQFVSPLEHVSNHDRDPVLLCSCEVYPRNLVRPARRARARCHPEPQTLSTCAASLTKCLQMHFEDRPTQMRSQPFAASRTLLRSTRAPITATTHMFQHRSSAI